MHHRQLIYALIAEIRRLRADIESGNYYAELAEEQHNRALRRERAHATELQHRVEEAQCDIDKLKHKARATPPRKRST